MSVEEGLMSVEEGLILPDGSGMVKKILQLIFRFAEACRDERRSPVISRFKLAAKTSNLLAVGFGLVVHFLFLVCVCFDVSHCAEYLPRCQ